MNFIMQISLFVICALACACGVALVVFEIVRKSKSKKRLTKEEKQRIKEDNARKELMEQINKCNARLDQLNKKK